MTGLIPGNRWDLLAPEPLDSWLPSRRVSVCVPSRDGGVRLDRALAALSLQTHPPELTEIVIVDDGSVVPVVAEHGFNESVDVVIHRCERSEGFGASAARNAAARMATGDVLVFLDGDVIAAPTMVAAMARWFDVSDDATILAAMRFVDVDHLSADELRAEMIAGAFPAVAARHRIDGQEWRSVPAVESGQLTSDEVDLYRMVTGAAFAVRRDRFHEIGGFREVAIRGVGDTEFGYRLVTGGAIVIPEPQALAWHQGRATLRGDARGALDAVRLPALQRMIPVARRRSAPDSPASAPLVAKAIVRIVSGGDLRRAAAAADRVRSLGGSDVIVEIVDSVLPDSGFAAEFAQIWIADSYEWGPATLMRIVDALSDPGVGRLEVPSDGASVAPLIAYTTRALRRCRAADTPAIMRVAVDEAFGVHWAGAATLDLRALEPGEVAADVSRRDRAAVVVARSISRLRWVGYAERRRQKATRLQVSAPR